MKWQKRECPIKMEITPYGSGWEDIALEIEGDRHWWSVSGVLGDGFWSLVECLYALHAPGNCQREEFRISDCYEYVHDCIDGKFGDKRPRTENDKEPKCTSHAPKTATCCWDCEGYGVTWTLTRPEEKEDDFPVTVKLEKDGIDADNPEKKTFTYVVRFSDLCYAVGKAITVAMKSHGFGGFYESVWESDINVRHLCFLKACGMGKPDFFRPLYGKEKGSGAKTSFADEIELLMFDM